jgi:ATP-dependent Lon protease
MIALGGNTDASVLEGHGYTYEGSVWGQIADILIRSKCMNPVIIFDELDKVSGTSKGDEIIGLLTHITDSTQNTAFQDKYFAGINIDLSRVLFVFTLNNRDTVNPVLMDRLRTIHTKGYSLKEKHIIGEKYLLPRLLQHYAIKDLNISEEAWKWILNERKEDGVRNLKRDLETIVSRLNLLQLFRSPKTDGKSTKTHKVKEPTKEEAETPTEDTKLPEETPKEDAKTPEEDLPKGVPRGIKWVAGKILEKDDVQILLEGRGTTTSNIPFGMYC